MVPKQDLLKDSMLREKKIVKNFHRFLPIYIFAGDRDRLDFQVIVHCSAIQSMSH